ncbi:trypco2 family protein [Streptomyces sp. B8F3]|uniref:trypco2 family protein n=1 Tax=unclassified Streptomyces TaxID=2593676 RepID=UPI00325C6649
MIELAEVIRALRRELQDAIADPDAGPLRFRLGPVEVETTVAVTRSGGAGGKVAFWVVEANADGRTETARTHRIAFTLDPTLVDPEGTAHAVMIADAAEEAER